MEVPRPGLPPDAKPVCAAPQDRYDEEIEVFRHHLEQLYKLCRPCQAAVEYYIKYQNRQLRALLLSHQFRRREADQTYMQVRWASTGTRGRGAASPHLDRPQQLEGSSSFCKRFV